MVMERKGEDIVVVYDYEGVKDSFVLNNAESTGEYRGVMGNGKKVNLKFLSEFDIGINGKYFRITSWLLDNSNIDDDEVVFVSNQELGVFYYRYLANGNYFWLTTKEKAKNQLISNFKPQVDSIASINGW